VAGLVSADWPCTERQIARTDSGRSATGLVLAAVTLATEVSASVLADLAWRAPDVRWSVRVAHDSLRAVADGAVAMPSRKSDVQSSANRLSGYSGVGLNHRTDSQTASRISR
jgi:hypothetical protein